MRKVRLASVMAVTVLAALFGPLDGALAGAITVTRFDDPAPAGACDPGDCSLREAIMAANAAPGPNSIALQAGTYTLTIEGDGDSIGSNGDLDVNDDLTLTGVGATGPTQLAGAAGTTTIDGAWASNPDRLIDITGSGDSLTLDGLTLQDGDTTTGSELGAAVFVGSGAVLSGSDLVVRSNQAPDSAGIDSAGLVSLSRVTFIDNHASGCCGALYARGSATTTLTDVAFIENTAGADTGAMYHDGASATLQQVAFVRNEAGTVGGALATVAGTLDVTNATFSGNRADDTGGGLWNAGSATTNLYNVTLSENVADADGEGSGQGGGIARSSGTVTLRNSIVAGNIDMGGQAPDCIGPIASGGNNIIGNMTGCSFTATTGDLQNVDPKLGPLADNGGFTETHALLKGSPAIGAAGPDAAPTDQRGLQRKDPDIGAYERVLCAKVPVNRIGTDGKDILRGTTGADGMLGLGGKDTLSGKGGKDGLCGGGGKDKLKGGGGKDTMKGQGGKDTCSGGGGKDKATCEKERTV
jgi:CSLREA domain-containing protein